MTTDEHYSSDDRVSLNSCATNVAAFPLAMLKLALPLALAWFPVAMLALGAASEPPEAARHSRSTAAYAWEW
jgi:hypothetical protein